MIRNNLAVLLAERQLKITRVSKDTNISRSTITAIAQNDTKMIQLEVIDKLCMYLNIEPNKFFSYIPIDIDISVDINSISLTNKNPKKGEMAIFDVENITCDIFIDVEDKRNSSLKRTYELEGISTNSLTFKSLRLEIEANFTENETNNFQEQEFINNFWSKIEAPFKIDVKEQLEESISNAVSKKILEDIKRIHVENAEDEETKKMFLRRYKSINTKVSSNVFNI